ncbi:MAG: type II secretion system F family protein [Euryarchaeota archaeon]|nr:type II secretion system F family protein [Euryarchaeota archaeon]
MIEDVIDLRQLRLGRLDHSNVILTVSIIIASILFIISTMSAIGSLEVPGNWLDYLFLGLMTLSGPYGIYKSHQAKRILDIERRFPEFLRDVAEGGRFGMTLSQAIKTASGGQYGSLTPEIQRMASQIDWGVPASEAMQLFAERVNTPLIHRMTGVIIKANDSGGDVADVLTMVAHDAREVILNRDERSLNMTTYMAVIYVAFAVFLFTIFILNATFLPKIVEAGSQVEGMSGMTSVSRSIIMTRVDIIPVVKELLILSVIVHAFGDGLLAGVLQNGKISNGLRHSFILLIIGFIGTRLI